MDGHKKQREQSARMIETALFELMEEKAFNEITVSEIVKRADVARRTFYRLYNRKESSSRYNKINKTFSCHVQYSVHEYSCKQDQIQNYTQRK